MFLCFFVNWAMSALGILCSRANYRDSGFSCVQDVCLVAKVGDRMFMNNGRLLLSNVPVVKSSSFADEEKKKSCGGKLKNGIKIK